MSCFVCLLMPLLPNVVRSDDNELQRELTEHVVPYLQKYCVECHGPSDQMAGIAVHELAAPDQLFADYRSWQRVFRIVDAGAMPPRDHEPRPEEAEQKRTAAFFREALLNFDCSKIDHPGRPTIRRLNRAEYNNTVRDLFGVSITPADAFPFDDVGEGFDNIGDVLSVPPLLMEKYLNAASQVAQEVVDLRDFSKPQVRRFQKDQLISSLKSSADGLGFVQLNSTGNVAADVTLSTAGTYQIRVEAAADQAGPELARIGFLLDEKSFAESTTREDGKVQWYEQSLKLQAGRHQIAAAFLNDFYDVNAADGRKDRNLGIRTIEVIGPAEGGPPEWHDLHRRFVSVRPGPNKSAVEAAAEVLKPILYRAFRRPISDDENKRYAALVDRLMSNNGETYERALSVALQAVLVSPDFLFRREADAPGDAAHWPLNDYEIAVRLSYFLWSSMPDDELLMLAERRQLSLPEILKQQIHRMLLDSRAVAMADNFASQWLNLRNLADARPSPELFPKFDAALRSAMEQETRLLFHTIVHDDLSIDEFLVADFTFVNKRLAEHYGIEGVDSDEFVRVSLKDRHRAGILTHASILTLTSNPGRTSPVKRGKWVLDNLLGQAPPPAPPAVPTLEVTAEAAPKLTLREQMELHRKDPGCASCHRVMDPLGMGLENFDAVGRWRDQDGEKPVDSSGELPTGEVFRGPLELAGILKGRRLEFHRSLAERMMVYAVGRGLDYYDKCAVDRILEQLSARGDRFSALIEGIVLSDPFLKRSRSRDPQMKAAVKE